MAIFKKEGVPPDIGKEESGETSEEEMEDTSDSTEDADVDEELETSAPNPSDDTKRETNVRPAAATSSVSGLSSASIAELERLKMQVEALQSMKEPYNQRFNRLNEQIGELRNMIINNEKELGDSKLAAMKASDILEAVHPEQFSAELQKKEAKIESLRAKLESNEEIANNIIEEMKEMRKHIELFRGSEGILKLSEEIKDDLIEVQKVKAIVQARADKAEQIFLELQDEFKDIQRINTLISDINGSVSSINSDINQFRIKLQDFATRREVASLKENLLKLSKEGYSFADKKDVDDVLLRASALERDIVTLAKLNDEIVTNIDKGKLDINEISRNLSLLQHKFDRNLQVIGDILEGLNVKVSSLSTGRKPKNKKSLKEFYKEEGRVSPLDLTKHLPKLLDKFKAKEEHELAKVSNYMKENIQKQTQNKIQKEKIEKRPEEVSEGDIRLNKLSEPQSESKGESRKEPVNKAVSEKEFMEKTEELKKNLKELSKPFPKIEKEKISSAKNIMKSGNNGNKVGKHGEHSKHNPVRKKISKAKTNLKSEKRIVKRIVKAKKKLKKKSKGKISSKKNDKAKKKINRANRKIKKISKKKNKKSRKG